MEGMEGMEVAHSALDPFPLRGAERLEVGHSTLLPLPVGRGEGGRRPGEGNMAVRAVSGLQMKTPLVQSRPPTSKATGLQAQ